MPMNPITKLVFATNNAHKIAEIKAQLGEAYDFQSLASIGCHEEIPETTPTLAGNAAQKARFVKEDDKGYLKVSFFGPFYGSYVVFELDKTGYEYAFISGPDTSYLWLLARKPVVSQDVMDRFMARAGELGFDLDELILVDQDQ